MKEFGPKLLFPQRGEIWLVRLDPTEGAEIRKTRPVVVISSDAIAALRLKLVVPLTGWQPKFARSPWLVRVQPDSINGLDKEDAADTLQTRCVSVERFLERKGRIAAATLKEVLAALAIVTEMDEEDAADCGPLDGADRPAPL